MANDLTRELSSPWIRKWLLSTDIRTGDAQVRHGAKVWGVSQRCLSKRRYSSASMLCEHSTATAEARTGVACAPTMWCTHAEQSHPITIRSLFFEHVRQPFNCVARLPTCRKRQYSVEVYSGTHIVCTSWPITTTLDLLLSVARFSNTRCC